MKQYAENEFIRYASSGVCRVEAVRRMEPPLGGSPENYYVLRPLIDPSETLYVPMANPKLAARMHPLLSKAEIDRLIMTSREKAFSWEEDRTARLSEFQRILRDCRQEELLGMVSGLYGKKQELVSQKKRLGAADDAALKRAERLLAGEFGFVLGISEESVGRYIRGLLGIPEPVEA